MDFPDTLNKMLASQEGMNTAMSLQGDDALTLVEILDQVSRLMIFGAPRLTPRQAFEAPNMALDTRRKSVRILRRVCSSQAILPRSCILSDDISKEADARFASGGFADIWKGRNNGNRVCVKAFRVYTTEMSKIKRVCSQ